MFWIQHSLGQYPDSIRLNDIRFIASHNSYKLKPDPGIISFLQKFKKRLGEELDPTRMDYGHVSLSEQFSEYEVRGVELDIYNDPKGGRFEKRRLNLFIPKLKQHSKDSMMLQPGFKMLHIADVDYESNYRTLKEALTEIRNWSEAHPGHTPIFINLELKDASPGDYSGFLRFLGFRKAIPFDSIAYRELDKDILSVFNRKELMTPEGLKDSFPSIRERINNIGWPALNDMLGKIVFILDGNGTEYKMASAEQLAFSYSDPADPSTAFVIRNNPVGNEKEIKDLSKLYIVRTRTDVETMEARNNDHTMLDAAIESQAQILSTDYYKADEKLSSYKVDLEKRKTVRSWPFILRKK